MSISLTSTFTCMTINTHTHTHAHLCFNVTINMQGSIHIYTLSDLRQDSWMPTKIEDKIVYVP